MALNDLTASVLTRSSGGNAIARAAYNARENLKDDATEKNHDYSRKGGLEAQGIHVAQNAPEWAKKLAEDREKLWNEVERREDKSTRPDQAQLARDFKIALPHELNQQQRLYLVKDFARELARQGMIVDWAIHEPNPHGDERNYHVHMLTTMRRLEEDGFGHKMRQFNKVEQLEKWKDRWSEMGAKAIERAGERSGHEEEFKQEADRFRHGHRTKAVQREEAIKRGDLEHAEACLDKPKIKLGAASGMERRGIKTEKGDVNRAIDDENELRADERRQARREAEIPEHLKGLRAEIWKAWHDSNNPKEFAETIREKRLELASVTKEEAQRSRKEEGKPHYREGEIVVVTEPQPIGRRNGQLVEPPRIHRLDYFTTGDTRARVDGFLSTLDRKPLKGIDATLKIQDERYLDRRDKRDAELSKRAEVVIETVELGRKTGSLLTGTLGSPMGKVADMVEGIFSPKLTPQQRKQGERAQRQREAQAQEAVVQRQQEADKEKDYSRER